MRFRKGQWVKGKLPSHLADRIGDPHKVAGDYFVGIYHPESRKLEPSVTKPGEEPKPPTWSTEPESITLVRPDGSDAILMLPGVPFQPAKVNPSEFRDLQPLDGKQGRSELPPGRTFEPDFIPHA